MLLLIGNRCMLLNCYRSVKAQTVEREFSKFSIATIPIVPIYKTSIAWTPIRSERNTIMFTKIMSQFNNKGIPLTPMSKKMMPSLYKTTVALKTWGLSGLSFGVTSFVLLCYVTEWRTVLQFCPYYNSKYSQLEIEDKLNKIKAAANTKERKENSLRDFQHERDVKFDSQKK